MATRTSRARYKAHAYSGPSKSKNRIESQLKRHHGEGATRANVWGDNIRKRSGNRRTLSCPESVKTYEADKTQHTVIKKACTPSSTNEPLSIEWPILDPELDSHNLILEKAPNADLSSMSGNRIVNLKHVLHWAFDMERHRLKCNGSVIEFLSEARNGFQSTFTFRCVMCNKTFVNKNDEEEVINKSFVWGAVTAGSYYSQASHITSIMDIPTISAKKFRTIEASFGKTWTDHLTEEIMKAGEQEKLIAKDKGQVTSDGTPFITVYVDGGWAKRSYGHNYNSSSGMACIIGKETKKCLYLGVRNKYCYTCEYFAKQNKDPKPHECFKNYQGPSTAMETSILVEGFQKSMSMHGLQYLSFIGDGDSSVFAQLKEKVSYGQHIKKIECKNHVVKNYTSALYKIQTNTKLPIYGRNLLKARLTKLTIVSRKIIIHNTNPTDMRTDLQNGPSHVFGRHDKCRQYYCKWLNSPSDTETEDEDLVDVMKDRAAPVWALICAANETVMAKAYRLSNETTNVAENFMSLVSKFNCGKRLNLCKAGSYQRRVQIAGLTHATGYKWHKTAWAKSFNGHPGETFHKYILQKEKARQKNISRKKSSFRKTVFRQPTKADKNYGPNADDPLDDIPPPDLRVMCEAKLPEFQISAEEIKNIEVLTVGQHSNDLYNLYRRDRLTASLFGTICKRRKTTPCHNHVKVVLYKSSVTSSDMAYGLRNESVARNLFMSVTRKYVREAGLFIDEEYGFLGASPDGLIEAENAILEIKCFPSLAKKSQHMMAAVEEKKNFPIIMKNGTLEMNKKHTYYYQVQGQLRVTKATKCYFAGFISLEQPLTIIEVPRDDSFIGQMIPKLVTFFKNCILPEIILRRVPKNSKCLDIADCS